MASKTALGYVLDDDGKLVDAFIQAPMDSDPAPTPVEIEIVRIVKEHRELRSEKEKATKLLDEIIVLFNLYDEDYSVIGRAKKIIAESRAANPGYPVTLSLLNRLKADEYIENKSQIIKNPRNQRLGK